MSDELRLPLTPEERERLTAAAVARAQTPEEFAHDLVMNAVDGAFTRALVSLRTDMAVLTQAEAPQPPRPVADPDETDAPMSSRDLRAGHHAA
ncbi:hypothetical protein [Actinacidiphila soli]|uniref:hypothetical protein n=1 Tax=Actinacidiphila soli TaxID=2487275 RepID=UPI000FC9D066|nr:hypothetical protein [Actinacidiphila soli]